jgi:hypothetical protein
MRSFHGLLLTVKKGEAKQISDNRYLFILYCTFKTARCCCEVYVRTTINDLKDTTQCITVKTHSSQWQKICFYYSVTMVSLTK